jgi:hypothetical protein
MGFSKKIPFLVLTLDGTKAPRYCFFTFRKLRDSKLKEMSKERFGIFDTNSMISARASGAQQEGQESPWHETHHQSCRGGRGYPPNDARLTSMFCVDTCF